MYLIDHSIFMGLHSENSNIRVWVKNFFIINKSEQFLMRLEDVGRCDSLIWKLPYETQAIYYPFMDYFHTLYNFKYIETSIDIVESAMNNKINLPFQCKLFNSTSKFFGVCKVSLINNRYSSTELDFNHSGSALHFNNSMLERRYQESLLVSLPNSDLGIIENPQIISQA